MGAKGRPVKRSTRIMSMKGVPFTYPGAAQPQQTGGVCLITHHKEFAEATTRESWVATTTSATPRATRSTAPPSARRTRSRPRTSSALPRQAHEVNVLLRPPRHRRRHAHPVRGAGRVAVDGLRVDAACSSHAAARNRAPRSVPFGFAMVRGDRFLFATAERAPSLNDEP